MRCEKVLLSSDLIGCVGDGLGHFCIEPISHVDCRRCLLDQRECVDDLERHAIVLGVDLEILKRTEEAAAKTEASGESAD